MKNSYLLSAVTAVAGFALAWTLKPDGAPATSTSTVPIGKPPVTKSVRPGSAPRGSALDSKRPKEVRAGDFPLADQADLGPKNRDEARMSRLTEALGLSVEQQGGIVKLIEDVQAAADGNVPVLQDLATRGHAVEEGLAKLLTPEQRAKFEELRVRERDNLVEARSQRMLTETISEIDLSPEQREDVLLRLREKTKADMQAIPSAATLLFDKSILPTNNRELSVDGVLLLSQIGAETISPTPGEGYEKVRRNQRTQLEEILRCFDGILTPGQMGQYHAALAETKAVMARVPSAIKQAPVEPDGGPQPKDPDAAEVTSEPILPEPGEVPDEE